MGVKKYDRWAITCILFGDDKWCITYTYDY